MKKPRPFSHKPIYIDSRQERLDAIRQRARHELGLDRGTDASCATAEAMHAAMRTTRRHDSAAPVSALALPVAAVILLVLLIAWRFLL